ncbi:type VI secretion system baseplate subunit TssF [uncultured Xylophilus sp.]|uniref:type VI secretion system baseplate subunit TssF n=1 Tax=uncultured Xylophilus sp. TaxID=296832 RepID=UPI0025ED9B74|nr:type VI secretion system baseplate subunit TssF [uncultured Xylophilus sp.]
MPDLQHSDLLHYYQRELSYLRGEGADFARRYPKIASRLMLHGSESLDPHTERLIESVAFLGARVHRDLDQEFPQIAMSLLDNLCPTLMQPLPSMTVAQFRLDPAQGKVTSGFRVARHTPLYAEAVTGEQCRFRTSWNTVLWPLAVEHAAMEHDGVLRITLACAEDTDFSELEIDDLRFHLQGDDMTVMPLYDALVSGLRSIVVAPQDGAPQVLPPDAWREVGYGEDETVLPLPAHAQPAYALLQEYFAFPRKFHFFDLRRLRGRLGSGRRCDLLLRLDRPLRSLSRITAENFALGCTPAINLFVRPSEPLQVDHRHHEYLLVADRLREANTEVHSVLSVTASNPDAARPIEVPSFAAASHTDTDAATLFWSVRRAVSRRADLPGTDVFMTFVDQTNTHRSPSEPVVYARLLCTNRQLAEQVPAGARLVAEGPPQPTIVRCLYEPTPQRHPPLDGETLWRLVSLLTLNHQSLVDGSTGTAQLREMLRLFASESRRDHQQIRGIVGLDARPVTAHVGTDAWRGFCRGTHVTLEFEDDAFAGGSSLLMAAVLARFFALYTSVNAFVRLSVRQGDETRKQWEPMTGRQTVL